MLFFLLSLSFDNPLARSSVRNKRSTSSYRSGGTFGSAREDTDVCPPTNSFCQMGQ
ncbi:hypothetical protein ZOSMA_91G00710 [Zostera marina]|uniref:Uncharacterized protein n=1 Tax=Zostera marina TaxID=29655 RepID=A0A0K9NLF6_ZOSMR|nr:hypothetical protein ZOSMA_91G00710 [Zostera marina]